MDEFTKIDPKVFRSFIGHQQELLACVKGVLKSFESLFVFTT